MSGKYEKAIEIHRNILKEGKDYKAVFENVDILMDYWRQYNKIGEMDIHNFWTAKTTAKAIAHKFGDLPPLKNNQAKNIFKEIVLSKRRDLVQKIVDQALEGDSDMLKILADRVLPTKRKDDHISMDMSGTIDEISKRILDLTGKEEITPLEANNMMTLLRGHVEITTLRELQEKLDRYEQNRDNISCTNRSDNLNIEENKNETRSTS